MESMIEQWIAFVASLQQLSFARPWVLIFLTLPLVYCFWQWVRTGHPVTLPLDHSARRHSRGLRFFVSCADFLPGLLLAVGIIIAAGPQRAGPPANERVMTNILFCLDVSGSMDSGFGGPALQSTGGQTRYDGAMAAIHEFTTQRKGDAFGLTIFGNEVLHWTPVTKDLSAIRLSTPFLRPGNLPPWFGGTSIGAALLACKGELAKHEEGDRAIILVTDGMSSDLHNGRDREIAMQLADKRIVTYVISVENGNVHPSMYTIAHLTGGEAFQAGNPEALRAIFNHIDQMQMTRIKEGRPVKLDFFQPFLAAGFVLLGMQLVSMFGWRYTPW
ncbi:VWA domain-containing protein [Candidatus Sumerlaeota bacterium]|nr:VWA domain-containing protein [Candidatus Sumerlaeota bacterium]